MNFAMKSSIVLPQRFDGTLLEPRSMRILSGAGTSTRNGRNGNSLNASSAARETNSGRSSNPIRSWQRNLAGSALVLMLVVEVASVFWFLTVFSTALSSERIHMISPSEMIRMDR
jgi:hypothetical protein